MNTKPNQKVQASTAKHTEKTEAPKSATTQTHKASLGEKPATHTGTSMGKQAHTGSKLHQAKTASHDEADRSYIDKDKCGDKSCK
jgi:hypothetical protein